MKKVCCIGSSHIATLKAGWDQIAPKWPGVEMTFFGSPNNRVEESMQFLTLEGRRIVPTDAGVTKFFKLTSGGLGDIDLDAYDAFVVMGGVGLTKPFGLYAHYRTDEQFHSAVNVLISAECLVESFVGIFRSSLPYRLTTALAQLTAKPVFLIPEPRPSESVLASSGSEFPTWDYYIKLIQKLVANGDHASEAHYYNAALQAVRQPGVVMADVHADMIVNGVLTPSEYSKGSVWLQSKGYENSPRDDFFHMNGDFGARVLSGILSSIA